MAIEKVQHQEVTAQKAKLVGDDQVNAETFEPKPEVNTESVPAQRTSEPDPAPTEVPVHEVHIALDEVITDTSDPRAVQIPDAGRGDASLPIHALAGPRVEDVFADKADEPTDDEPADEPTDES